MVVHHFVSNGWCRLGGERASLQLLSGYNVRLFSLQLIVYSQSRFLCWGAQRGISLVRTAVGTNIYSQILVSTSFAQRSFDCTHQHTPMPKTNRLTSVRGHVGFAPMGEKKVPAEPPSRLPATLYVPGPGTRGPGTVGFRPKVQAGESILAAILVTREGEERWLLLHDAVRR